jgi:hypothetical protein
MAAEMTESRSETTDPEDTPMSRHDYARRQTLAMSLRPVLNAIAVVATCAVAAFAGAII